eukprot:scaffold2558_cov172-Amphora_coffeaeformis.AAC.16
MSIELDADELRRRQERRRKRKRLKNHMQNQGSNPLFSEFLTSEFDVPQNDEVIVIQDSDDDNEDEEPPIVIDVDVQLGLKEVPLSPASVSSSAVHSNNATSADRAPRIHTRSAKKVSVAAAVSTHFNIHTDNQQSNSALEEGWYEGVVSPIAMPEDAAHLNAVHCFVRENLEFFSSPGSASSRRKRGRVGLRCIHCAAQAVQDPSFSWPTGGLSHPNTFASVHQACSQRFQVHWQTACPSMPSEVRAHFKLLLQEMQHPGRPAKRSRGGYPVPTYYTLSMQRLGLVETQDGLRFSRDLKLEPLPLESVRATLEAQTINVDDHHGSMEAMAGNLPAPVSSSSDAAMKEIRGSIDEAAERVLAECIAETDRPEKYLARGSDKALVTDYIFITIRQMALCHALPEDLSARGKKTKMMQVGFAGFCCRFCQDAAGGTSVSYMMGSCRSFLSAADNLGSAITNSFTQHIQKCRYVPHAIQKAMGVFKRIHQRQMGFLPYGAQRRFFHLLWDRLREADKSTEEVEASLPPKVEPPANGTLVTGGDQNRNVESAMEIEKPELNGCHKTVESLPTERPVNFPESSDEATRRVLREAETVFAERKVAASKYLLLPEERNLVSDYVFLTLMQLTPVAPTAADQSRSRRPLVGGLMGIACIHCLESERMITPSGRSFPSAPDNFASTLNSSLYSHLQACDSVPHEIKRAFANLRKLHSAQCSSLVFGSQRRYFNLLFSRLRQLYTGMNVSGSEAPSFEPRETLETLGFLHMKTPSGQLIHMCKRCRMVPAAFRARDAVCYDRLSLSRARVHRSICQEDGLDLSLTLDSFVVAAAALEHSPAVLSQNTAFQNLVSAAVGRKEELKQVFIKHVLAMLQKANDSNEEISESSNDCSEVQYRGLWKHFPHEVSYEDVHTAYQEMALSFGLQSSLRESSALLDYLMIISPTLIVPDDVSERTTPVAEAKSSGVLSTTEVEEAGKPMNGIDELAGSQ